MPNPSVVTPLIGPSLTNVFKPVLDGVNPAGNAIYDRQAPFALGTTVTCAGGLTGGRDMAQFCRVGIGIGVGATAGITNGVSVAAAAGNTYTNDTGVALIVGDYAWLTAPIASSP